MLLDDPLSAVDVAVSRHLFDRYIVTQVVHLSSVSFIQECQLATSLVQAVTYVASCFFSEFIPIFYTLLTNQI